MLQMLHAYFMPVLCFVFVPDLTMSDLCLPSGVLFTADPWLISATCPSERDAAAFRFADRLRFAVGFAELHGGSVTRTVTGQWVKMGCCLPGPSNPGITGNQPVWKRRDIVMLSHQRMGEPREARCLNLLIDQLVGALRGGWVVGAAIY